VDLLGCSRQKFILVWRERERERGGETRESAFVCA